MSTNPAVSVLFKAAEEAQAKLRDIGMLCYSWSGSYPHIDELIEEITEIIER